MRKKLAVCMETELLVTNIISIVERLIGLPFGNELVVADGS